MSKKSKVFKLKESQDYTQWKYILEQEWSLDPRKRELLTGEILLEDLKGRHQNQVKAYQIADQKMRLEAISRMSSRYARLVLHKETLIDMWKTLEKRIKGEKEVRLMKIKSQLRNLEWRGSLQNLLTRFNELVEEYQLLEGTWAEQDLADELIRALPKEYDNVVTQIRIQLKTEGSDTWNLDKIRNQLEIADI